MTIVYWILTVLAGIFASGTALSFVIFIVTGDDLWGKRARNLRRLTSAVLLLMFNLWVWGRVISIIIHW
ncbi:hypothetical protein [Piscinibacter terrae]|uniref:Uncharacterized protein n=1 Tax=Piscinibacter terrae TaxID=2496871 RepID=A0A3N7HHL7_9BURK|nr:hypothetical protein [Albitalea terrae]RQP21544.1 hypothetical protein DZC73_26880 [Albitalea terrae]